MSHENTERTTMAIPSKVIWAYCFEGHHNNSGQKSVFPEFNEFTTNTFSIYNDNFKLVSLQNIHDLLKKRQRNLTQKGRIVENQKLTVYISLSVADAKTVLTKSTASDSESGVTAS